MVQHTDTTPMHKLTPSQTIGPFFAYGLTPESYGGKSIASNNLVMNSSGGQPVRITGRVLDGEGNPIDDAMIEIWQADENGHYKQGAEFHGLGRCATDEQGVYEFNTIKPGRVPDQEGVDQAPHIHLVIFLRGLLTHVFSRIYFSDEEVNNSNDNFLNSIDPLRRQTLVGLRRQNESEPVYDFDIHMQGKQETVFFEYSE